MEEKKKALYLVYFTDWRDQYLMTRPRLYAIGGCKQDEDRDLSQSCHRDQDQDLLHLV